MPRFDRLPDIGRVRVYDSGPNKGADRYTVLFEDMEGPNEDGGLLPYRPRTALGMSPLPDDPYGVSQWCAADPGPHLGKRIPFAALPENVQRHVIARATPEDA